MGRSTEELERAIREGTNNGEVHTLLQAAIELEQQGGEEYRVLIDKAKAAAAFLNKEYDVALGYYTSVIKTLSEREGVTQLDVAPVMSNIGNVYYYIANYPEALDHYYKALEYFEEGNQEAQVASVLLNIGMVQHAAGNYDGAMLKYNQAREKYKANGNTQGEARVVTNLGSIYGAKKQYVKALELYYYSLNIYKEFGNTEAEAMITANIIDVMLENNMLAKAKELQAWMDSVVIINPSLLIHRETNRALIQEKEQKPELAQQILKNALSVAIKNQLKDKQIYIHERLRNVAYAMNNMEDYVLHNEANKRLEEEAKGSEQQWRLLVHEKQREIVARDKEHQKYLAVLHSTLPRHIADRVAKGEMINDYIEYGALLFMDIVGFTSMSSATGVSNVVKLLDTVFTICDEVCEKNGVIKIKTIGDAYMAAAGLEKSTQDPAVALANVAIEIVKNIHGIKMPKTTGQVKQEEIKVRIGLHCGPVVAGVIGKQRLQYDVWGDTVNIASRMESSGEAGKIHITQAYGEKLQGHNFNITQRGIVDIKGKGQMQTLWLEVE